MDLTILSFGPEGWGDELARGAWLTLALALSTLPFGLVIGLIVALAKDSRSMILRGIGNVYTTIFRALPELLTILIIYHGGQALSNRIAAGMGFSGGVEINGFVAGMLALGVVLGAFSSEVWLGGLRGVAKGQREGAHALGLSRFTAFYKVVFPQVLRLSLPGLGNNWLALLKDTALVSVIAFTDLMRITNVAVGFTKRPILFYAICCVLYLLMSTASGFILHWLERRSARGYSRSRA